MADWFDGGTWSFLDNAPVTGLGSDAATFNPDVAASSTFNPAAWTPQIDWSSLLASPTAPPADLTRGLNPFLNTPDPRSGTAPTLDFAPENDAAGLVYDQRTGDIVRVATGERVLDGASVARLAAAVKAGDAGTVAAILEPVNKALNTPLGGTLAALGLGGLGVGLARSVAGDAGSFRPPARIQGVGMNPAARALAEDIRMRNLRGLTTLTPDAATSGDPVTADLAARLRKALAGEISNPVLERAQRKDNERFETSMLRKTGGSPLWDKTSAGLEGRALLDESHVIQRYLDNQDTIARLDPAVRARQSEESDRLARLSGINTMDADWQYENALAMQHAQNDYLLERQDKADLAKAIASIFGTAAGGVTGGSRRPWDRGVTLVPAG